MVVVAGGGGGEDTVDAGDELVSGIGVVEVVDVDRVGGGSVVGQLMFIPTVVQKFKTVAIARMANRS